VGQTTSLQLDSTQLEVKVLKTGLQVPWDMDWAADGWIWFSERRGTINRLNPESGSFQQIHQLPDVYQSPDNSGLHALALHPGFPATPYLYVHYTYHSDTSKLVRFIYNTESNKLESPTILLDDILASDSHNGSRIVFSEDSKLFLCIGDAYRGSTPQDLQYVNGKILRLNLDGSVPADNPVVGNPVWSWGHRNPQGLVFARGLLYSSEHGTGEDDELNLIRKGGNYGWPKVQGYCNWNSEIPFCADSGVTEPLITWTPTAAPAGLAYYDHPAIPEWRHSLLQVFLKANIGYLGQRMQQIRLSDDGQSVLETRDFFDYTFGRLRDVLVAPDGRVFICTSNRETNGLEVVKPDDDKIIQLRNPAYSATPLDPAAQARRLLLFPNPAREVLHLRLGAENGPVGVEMYDVLGRRLLHARLMLRAGRLELRRGHWPGGMYVLHLSLPDRSQLLRRIQWE